MEVRGVSFLSHVKANPKKERCYHSATTMLPDFPSIRQELDAAISYKLRTLTREKSVIAKLIKGITQHEGKELSFHQEGTGTVTSGYQAMTASATVRFDEVPELMGDKLNAKLEEISSSIAKQMSDQFYSKIHEETEKVGNVVDAKGGLLTKELALELLSKPLWTPDSVFLVHPTMAEYMTKAWAEWQTDADFMAEYNDLNAMKKEEWRVRESYRKLVS
jgi:hypothetical protein